jgi:3-methyladenine DNA glycosylase/8-oxoguanine DNA glycosylase
MPLMHSFALPVQLPFDWESLLAFLRLRATPGVETVTDSAYMRTITIGVAPQTLSVTFDRPSASLQVVYSQSRYSGNAHSRNTGARSMVESRAKQIFKTEVSTGPIEVFLGRDAWLDGLVARRPGLRVPGGWCGFEIAVRAILGQQVSVPAATTLMGRVVRLAGSRCSETSWLFPTPEQVLKSSLSGLGVPGSRLQTLKSLAAFFVENGSCLTQPDVKGRLLAVKGIGRWTAGYILMRTGDDQDHWPEGDLVLRKALSKSKALIAPARLEQAFRRWTPYRSYAAIHIWRGYVPLAVSRKP